MFAEEIEPEQTATRSRYDLNDREQDTSNSAVIIPRVAPCANEGRIVVELNCVTMKDARTNKANVPKNDAYPSRTDGAAIWTNAFGRQTMVTMISNRLSGNRTEDTTSSRVPTMRPTVTGYELNSRFESAGR